MEYTITNIQYDTDGEKVKLPKSLQVIVPDYIKDKEEIEEFVSDAISNITGFCHKGFAVTPEVK